MARKNPSLCRIPSLSDFSLTTRGKTMQVLSQEDHTFFAQNGYVIVHNAVPQENLDAVIDAIWEFLGMDRNDPEDWYREPLRSNGMVEMYQHQAMWNNR